VTDSATEDVFNLDEPTVDPDEDTTVAFDVPLRSMADHEDAGEMTPEWKAAVFIEPPPLEDEGGQ
jgi:hypothetical protein